MSAVGVHWSRVREEYAALAGRAYLDTACKGIPARRAAGAVVRHVERLQESPGASTTEETIVMLDAFDRARAAAAALIGAEADEIALVPSTEAGISAVAGALSAGPGANVVASDLEFLGTVLPWRMRGYEVRFVPHRDGSITTDDLEAAVDRRTAAIIVSSVQEVNGFRVDLDALSEVCRAHGTLLVVDAIQHVGPLSLDVAATPLDAVAVGGHKWLCAPFGMGFLYVSRRIHERLRPERRAFMTALPPHGDWSGYLESPLRRPDDELRFPGDARQLELGALGTTLAATGLAAQLEELLGLGAVAIAERSAALVRETKRALSDVGAEIATPEFARPSSIVTFRASSDVGSERELVARLAAADVLTSLRYTTGVGGIRVSPYFYNDENDIDRLADIVAHHRRAG